MDLFTLLLLFTTLLFAALLAAIAGFVLAQKYVRQIRRRFGIDIEKKFAPLNDRLSRFAPEFYWHRNRRVGWLKSAAWQEYTQPVWGYVDVHSAVPGDTVRVFLSKDVDLNRRLRGRLIATRVSSLEESPPIWSSDVMDVPCQKLNYEAAALGTWWDKWCDLTLDDQWESGFYRFHFIAVKPNGEDGAKTIDVAFLVVRNAEANGDILLKIPTATYAIYNAFGGHSAYNSNYMGKGKGNRGQLVSFDRPCFMRKLRVYEQFMITWIEEFAAKHGVRVDYTTSYDIYRDADTVAKYPLMVMTGHDEYWSKEEFDNVYRRTFELGKNTMFLCGNSVFWQVRFVDTFASATGDVRNRQLVCMKSPKDPVRYRFDESRWAEASLELTTRFRDEARRPETMMQGVAYAMNCGGAGAKKFSYYVADTDLPFFKDTGYKAGDFAADVIGHEWDSRDPDWYDDGSGAELSRLWDPERSQIPYLDAERMHVVLQGEGRATDGKMRPSEAVYFETDSGAKVFSSGTVAWAHGLSKPDARQESFRQLNENLFLYFLDRLEP
ncbi:MAG: N,N-dimethylformamidase beta subunit family domain-containing protein [Pseudomonadota bacterium]